MSTITREFVDIAFPKHGRTSCSDEHPSNWYPHYDNGAARCNRCLALNSIGRPVELFEIEATIRLIPDPAEVRERALSKLSPLEKQALGL